MIRVLQILDSINVNGTETFIMNVFRNISHHDIMFDFLVSQRTHSVFEKEIESYGSNIYTFNRRNLGLRKHIKSLNDFFDRHAKEYAAVHLHGNSFTSLMPLVIAKKFGIPIRIAHSHNTSTHGMHNKLLHYLNRFRIKTIATDFLACSQEAKKWGFGGTKCFTKACVIPNGIELDKFNFNKNKREDIRAELNLGDSFVIGNIAAFRDAKNHPFILEIFKEINKKDPDAKLLLIGEGERRDKIFEMAKELKLEHNIKFLGSRNDVADLLQALDVFLFPSKYEGLGIVTIEAQAAGLPVIASTNVPRETAVTSLIHFLPLSASAKEWSTYLLQHGKNPCRGIIQKDMNRFDIRATCELLQKIYIKN